VESALVSGAIPAAAAVGGGLLDVCTSVAVHNIDAKKSRSEEEDGSQEEEGEVGSELVTGIAACNTIPVPDRATVIVIVSTKSERDQGSGEEKEIHGPVDKASHEWQEEKE